MALYTVSVDGVALVAATAKSLLELAAPANQDALIKEWWIEFDGVTASAVPVKVEIGRFTAAVTTATTLAGVKHERTAAPANLVIAKHSTTTEGAGTAESGIATHRIPPTSGFHYIAPLGQEMYLAVSTFWRVRATAAAAVNATCGVMWEE